MADTGLANHVAIRVSNLEKLVNLIQKIEQSIHAGEVFHACALTYEFLLELSTNLQRRIPEKLVRILESMKIGIPQNLSLEDFAEEFHLSRSTLHRLFKEHLGTTPKEYYRTLKLDFARRLLQDADSYVKEIAERSGFPDPVSFSHAFRKMFRCSPLEYRRSSARKKKRNETDHDENAGGRLRKEPPSPEC